MIAGLPNAGRQLRPQEVILGAFLFYKFFLPAAERRYIPGSLYFSK
jgi:hypothetical protein